MKCLSIKKISIALAVVLSSSLVNSAWAEASTSTSNNTDKQVELLSQQTAALQQQLQELQKQIAELKSQKAAPVATPVSASTKENTAS